MVGMLALSRSQPLEYRRHAEIGQQLSHVTGLQDGDDRLLCGARPYPQGRRALRCPRLIGSGSIASQIEIEPTLA